MRPRIFSTTLLTLGLAAVVHGQEDAVLSVRILEKLDPSRLEIESPDGKGVWNEIKLSRGLLWVNGKAGKRASWGKPGSTVKLRVKNLTRVYPGRVNLSVRKESEKPELFIENQVSLEDYAACVMAFESGYDRSQHEYLKALGSVIRLYALSHRRRHPGYDLCDLSHCQVYQGLPPRFESWRELIAEGISYTGKGGKGAFYFHRCCGGLLQSPHEIWGGTATSNRTGPDEWKGETLCKADPFFQWDSTARAEDIANVFREMAEVPARAKLKALEVTRKTSHGRNRTLQAVFELPSGRTQEIRVNAPRFVSRFGKRYGWRVFPSLWFDIKKDGDLFKFQGKGFGHGVGLCQSGALALARAGWKWRDILNFYFPARESR